MAPSTRRLPDYSGGFRRVQAVEEALYRTWMRERRDKDRVPGVHDKTVPFTSVPARYRDGKFSFWKDIRPPFTVTGLGALDNTDPEFQELVRHGIVRELSIEVFKVEYEVYLNHDVERSFGLVEDNRLFSTAIVLLPSNFPKSCIQVLSWGSKKTSSTFVKKLEFLFKPESKKTFSPTKGLDPDWSMNGSFGASGSTDVGSRVSSAWPSPNDDALTPTITNNGELNGSTYSNGGNSMFKSVSFDQLKNFSQTGSSFFSAKSGASARKKMYRNNNMSSSSFYGTEGGRAIGVGGAAFDGSMSHSASSTSFFNSHYNASWLSNAMKKKYSYASSPDLTRKIMTESFDNARDTSHKTHKAERFELQYGQGENSLSRKIFQNHSPRTFYKDPDLHKNKTSMVDAVPLYGSKLLGNVNFTARKVLE